MASDDARGGDLHLTASCHSASKRLAGVKRETVSLETTDRERGVLRQGCCGREFLPEAIRKATEPFVVQKRWSRQGSGVLRGVPVGPKLGPKAKSDLPEVCSVHGGPCRRTGGWREPL